MKLKHIKRNLSISEKTDNNALKEEMFALLHERYAEEVKKNPDSNEVFQVQIVMTEYNCSKTAEEKKNDDSFSSKAIQKRSSSSKSNAMKLGSSFTNPYNFMPFTDSRKIIKEPTPHTIDETEERYSGILKFSVKLNSPLMTLKAEPENKVELISKYDSHARYKALTIGESVIYPATGVRGALRHLMTMVAGSRLRHLDNEMYLVDKRWNSNDKSNKNLQLALVTQIGGREKVGKVVLGKQKPIKLLELKTIFRRMGKDINKYRDGKPIWVKWNNENENPQLSFSSEAPKGYNKMLKLSGIPISKQKNEWIFEPDFSREITLPPGLWVQYMNRYINSPFNELSAKNHNIVWLEPTLEDGERKLFIIKDGGDVQSIQWSKWGKEGDKFSDLLPDEVKPAYQIGDYTKVDEITDLFGQVPSEKEFADKAPTFAGRIRSDNLVFSNTKNKLQSVVLAPLTRPHAGCKPFYRNSRMNAMKGYKVYHTTKEKDKEAPHHYNIQPIYEKGKPKQPPQQKMNKTVELLPEGTTGSLSISFKALSAREYALLRLTCSLPQRFGGGKPFGLGLCTMELDEITNEYGQKIDEPVENWKIEVSDLSERVELYKVSQKPVDKLRYPCAADENRFTVTRAGHVWFSYNVSMSENKDFIKSFPVTGEAKKKLGSNLSPQPLPALSINGVLLYGYDVYIEAETQRKKKYVKNFEPFNPKKHIKSRSQSSYNYSSNKESRQKRKEER